MTRILALDLSITATGMCHPAGVTDTFRPASQGDRRLMEIRNHIVAYPAPELAVMEGPFMSKNTAGLLLTMLHGVIRVALMSNHVPYLVVAPATLKIYATGSGRATKPDMRMALFQRYDLDLPDDNQVDAWWLWALAHDLAGDPVLRLPKTHRRALDGLVLPKGYS